MVFTNQEIETLRYNEDRYRSIVEAQTDLICRFRTDGRLTFVNEAFCRHFGKTREDLYHQDFLELIPKEDRPLLQHNLTLLSRENPVISYEHRVVTQEGSARWQQWTNRAVLDESGQIEEFQAVGRDITQRKRSEEVLGMTQFSVDCAADAIFRIGSDGRYLYVNDSACKALGYSCEELLSMTVHDVDVNFPASAWPDYWQELKRRASFIFETSYRTSDGRIFPIELTVNYFVYNDKEFCYASGHDITERKKASVKIREQAALLDKAQDAILVIELNGNLIYWNKSAERLYGWTAAEVLGRNADELLYPPASKKQKVAHEQVRAQDEWMGELSQVTKQGQTLLVQSRWTLVRDEEGQPKGVLVVNTDLTEQKQLEAKFLRAQRLESIGTLASGIAHDLNNVLAPILMATEMLHNELTTDAARSILSIMEVSARRGADIVKQVLAFGRGVAGAHMALHARHLAKEVAKIARETFPKSIIVETELATNLWTITGDVTQLHQVLLNLCVNSRDALLPQGGTLAITAENTRLDDTYVRMNPEAKAGPYVVISVTDTGSGIPPAILDKIFDPFFTTKEVGKGTGLGLSTALGIIRDHGGFMQVSSQLGKGTQFKIYLPANETASIKPVVFEKKIPYHGQGELILVVEDEEPVRQITRQTLEANGYRVLTATDGTEAVALYVQHLDEIKLVLTDMMMPVMGGIPTIRALRKIQPQIQVIAISGTLTHKEEAEALGACVRAFLIKPFTADVLLKTLQDVLAGKEIER